MGPMEERRETYYAVPRLDTKRTGVALESFAVPRGEFLARLRSPAGHTLAEYLCPGNSVCKLYFDAECYYASEADAAADQARYHADVTRAMDCAVAAMSQALSSQEGGGGATYDVACRHGSVVKRSGAAAWKLSYRTYVSGVRVLRHSDIPAMMPSLFPAELLHIWDLSVYKASDQIVSAVLGFKTTTDRRRLVPARAYDDDEALLRFVVQHTEPSWPAMEAPPRAEAAPLAYPSFDEHEVDGEADEEIADLVGMLGEATASSYERWRNVGIVLKSADASGGRPGGDRYIGLYHAFSRKSASKYDGPASVQEMWASLCRAPERADGVRQLTVGTLRMYAKDDSPVEYARWKARKRERGRLDDRGLARTRTEATGEMSRAGSTSETSQTSGEAMEGARRLLTAMGLRAGEVIDVEPPAADDRGSSVSFSATRVTDETRMRARCTVRLGLKDLRAVMTLEDGTVVYDGHLNKDVGLEVKRDLCRVHAAIPADQTWTVTRPSARNVVFRGAERGSEVSLCNADRPQGEMVARVKVPDAKPHQVTSKGQIVFMCEAYQESIARTLAKMNMGWATGNGSNDDDVALNWARSDDELSAAWLAVYQGADREERGMNKIVKDGSDFFLFDERSGTWHARSAMESSNHMLRAMKSVGNGAFWTALSDVERKYVGSDRGGKAVFNRSVNAMWGDDFRDGLDTVLSILPFKNGAFDTVAGTFRPLRWDDYVSKTIGYDYVPPELVPEEQHAYVRGFFEQVLPVPEERELVLKMLGSALDGKLVNKRFLVLQDRRGGDNGKSMVVKAAEAAMGTLCMPNQSAFLSAASSTNPNAHEANTLGYKGKRLAIFDETDPKVRFDLAKLKSITGGAPRMAVRGAGATSMTQFHWSAFVLIACNKGCLPQIDASDTAFLTAWWRCRCAPSSSMPMSSKMSRTAFRRTCTSSTSCRRRGWP